MTEKVRYPRKIVFRSILRALGRAVLPLLSKPVIRGRENFPHKGPLILVGNHTGVLEVVYMTIYAPRIVEYVGGMDIPHEWFVNFFIKLYGVIPILRGQTSRSSLMKAVSVLKQNGFLGIFPEGGIWEPAIHNAHTGVAWLSYHTQVPVLPIGFASTQGALNKAMRLQRPEIEMNVGKLIPAVSVPEGKPRKQHFQDAANEIMDAVWELVPESARKAEIEILDERFEFHASAVGPNGDDVAIPEELRLRNGPALSKVLHRPTLFNNFRDNLGLPVHALKKLYERPGSDDLLTATGAILDYLENDNPYYFTYRYGQREGSAMQNGIQELHDLVQWAASGNVDLQLTPIRRYRTPESPEEIVLDRSEEIEKL